MLNVPSILSARCLCVRACVSPKSVCTGWHFRLPRGQIWHFFLLQREAPKVLPGTSAANRAGAKKNSYSMWLKPSLAQVHATAPGRLSYSFILHKTKKVCLRGLKIKAQYRQGLRNKTDFKFNVFGNEIIFVGKRFVRVIFYDDKTRIISNVSESATFQNQQRFRISNVSESATFQNQQRFGISNVSESETFRNQQRFRISNVSESATFRNQQRFRIRNQNQKRLAISNVSELKRGGHRMASFDELKIGLPVDAYWPYTGSFYVAVVTTCNGKCAAVFFVPYCGKAAVYWSSLL